MAFSHLRVAATGWRTATSEQFFPSADSCEPSLHTLS
jgi:hypothetical protein